MEGFYDWTWDENQDPYTEYGVPMDQWDTLEAEGYQFPSIYSGPFIYDQKFMDTLAFINALPEKKGRRMI